MRFKKQINFVIGWGCFLVQSQSDYEMFVGRRSRETTLANHLLLRSHHRSLCWKFESSTSIVALPHASFSYAIPKSRNLTTTTTVRVQNPGPAPEFHSCILVCPFVSEEPKRATRFLMAFIISLRLVFFLQNNSLSATGA